MLKIINLISLKRLRFYNKQMVNNFNVIRINKDKLFKKLNLYSITNLGWVF